MSESLDTLEELRNANKRPTQEEVDRYNQLERDIKKREQYQDFLNHPITKEIVERITSWIKDWNVKLINGKGDDRMVDRRDNLLDVLKIFSPTKAETKHFLPDMEQEINAFKEYYKGHPNS